TNNPMAFTVLDCQHTLAVSQRLSRWLLMSLDRMRDNNLAITQESIANLPGIRRASATQTARQLQEEGLITYSRGRITVIDRSRLEAQACECHAVVKEEYERLLPHCHGQNSSA